MDLYIIVFISWNSEENSLRVLYRKVLKRIFGPMRKEKTCERRNLYQEKLCNTYTLPETVKSRRMKYVSM
jgi:hypothetical protein